MPPLILLLTHLAVAEDRDIVRTETLPHTGGRRVALVIGVEDYRNGIPQLAYAVDDAQAMARALIESGSFLPQDVIVLTSSSPDPTLLPTRVHILEQLERLQHQEGVDLALVYFSGHGSAEDVGGQRENYIFPQDTSMSVLEDSGLKISTLLAMTEAIPASARLVLLDACRNDPNAKSVSNASGGFMQERYNLEGTVALFGVPFGQTAQEVEGLGHGAFTAFLVEGLEGHADGYGGAPDGVVSVQEVYRYARDHLAELPRDGGPQEPTFAGEWRGDDLAIVNVRGHEPVTCPARQRDLDAAQDDAFQQCANPDRMRFLAAATRARATLACLEEPLTAELDIRDHQLGALYHLELHDLDTAARELRAGIWTGQQAHAPLDLPEGCLVDGALRQQAEQVPVGSIEIPRAPPEGRVRVAGLKSATMPGGVPVNLQVYWGYARAEPPKAWGGTGPLPVLSDAVKPDIALERQRATRLMLGAGGVGVAGIGVAMVGRVMRAGWQDQWEAIHADPPDDQDAAIAAQDQLRVRINAVGAGAVALEGIAIGLGVWALTVRF